MKIHELFAYLHVKDAAKAIEFYSKAFGAKEEFRLTEPSGRIGHAELDFGGTTLMLADEFPEYGLKGPTAFGATTVSIHIHVDDADEVIRRAVDAGGSIVIEPKDHSMASARDAYATHSGTNGTSAIISRRSLPTRCKGDTPR